MFNIIIMINLLQFLGLSCLIVIAAIILAAIVVHGIKGIINAIKGD